MDRPPMTEQQQKVLAFVQQYARRHGFPPTLREIGGGLGLPNVNAVRGHLSALEKKGYISKESDKARSIRLLGGPSLLSRFRRALHEWARTDEGVLHTLLYGLAWTTWRRTPLLTGQRRQWMEEAFQREALEHGWGLVDAAIGPDHVALVVKVWPNHAPEQTVRRFQAVGNDVRLRHRREFPGGRLWGQGYVATTDLSLLDDMTGNLLDEQASEDSREQAPR